jgi:uncharacterized protein
VIGVSQISAYVNQMSKIDPHTQIELEAAAFRRLITHLRGREDVQNLDLMNLASFCRNCLANWYEDAARDKGVAVTRDDARQHVYGMPYDDWKAKHQTGPSQAITPKSH